MDKSIRTSYKYPGVIRANAPTSNNDLEDRLKHLGKSPYPAYTTAALLAAQIPRSLKHAPGSPSLVGCISFAAIFAGAGWIVTKDEENGTGTLTAWSLAYLLLLGGRTLKSRHPLPILATTSVALNAVVYSKRYFGW